MSLCDDPIYRLAAAGRGPRAWRDARGWLLGRGRDLAILRMLPVLAVAANIALDPGKSPNHLLQSLGRQALWVAPLAVVAPLVAMGAAHRAARHWETGRMCDWLMTPITRSDIATAQILASQIPAAAALMVGTLLATGAWWLSWALGCGTPCFAPGEGMLLALEGVAAAGAAGAVGTGIGNALKRSVPAVVAAAAAGVAPAVILCYVLLFTVTHGTDVGPHVTAIALVWLVGRLGRTVTMRHLARREVP